MMIQSETKLSTEDKDYLQNILDKYEEFKDLAETSTNNGEHVDDSDMWRDMTNDCTHSYDDYIRSIAGAYGGTYQLVHQAIANSGLPHELDTL